LISSKQLALCWLLLRYAVALVDATAGRAVLAPAGTLFSMTQCVSGVDDIEPAEFTDPTGTGSAGVKKRSLVDTFGSKKKQRQMRSVAASQVKPEESSSVGALHAALDDSAVVEKMDLKGDAALNTSHFPPYDLTATELADVYPVHGVIPEEVWEQLDWHVFLAALGKDKERFVSSLSSTYLVFPTFDLISLCQSHVSCRNALALAAFLSSWLNWRAN